jgi:hypothetical protein
MPNACHLISVLALSPPPFLPLSLSLPRERGSSYSGCWTSLYLAILQLGRVVNAPPQFMLLTHELVRPLLGQMCYTSLEVSPSCPSAVGWSIPWLSLACPTLLKYSRHKHQHFQKGKNRENGHVKLEKKRPKVRSEEPVKQPSLQHKTISLSLSLRSQTACLINSNVWHLSPTFLVLDDALPDHFPIDFCLQKHSLFVFETATFTSCLAR